MIGHFGVEELESEESDSFVSVTSEIPLLSPKLQRSDTNMEVGDQLEILEGQYTELQAQNNTILRQLEQLIQRSEHPTSLPTAPDPQWNQIPQPTHIGTPTDSARGLAPGTEC